MRVYIQHEEVYPVLSLRPVPETWAEQREIPRELYERWLAATEAYVAVQVELRRIASPDPGYFEDEAKFLFGLTDE